MVPWTRQLRAVRSEQMTRQAPDPGRRRQPSQAPLAAKLPVLDRGDESYRLDHTVLIPVQVI